MTIRAASLKKQHLNAKSKDLKLYKHTEVNDLHERKVREIRPSHENAEAKKVGERLTERVYAGMLRRERNFSQLSPPTIIRRAPISVLVLCSRRALCLFFFI